MALDINFEEDTFNVEFKDVSENFSVEYKFNDGFNVEFTDGTGDSFAVDLVDTNTFDVSFEQVVLNVSLQEADAFEVSFVDNTFDVVFDEDSFDVQFADLGPQGIPGPPGGNSSVTFVDTSNVATTLGVDFEETEAGVVTATVDASSIGKFTWPDIIIGGSITERTTDVNGDKLYKMLFQNVIYWRLFQTSPKVNIIYKGNIFDSAVEYTRKEF